MRVLSVLGVTVGFAVITSLAAVILPAPVKIAIRQKTAVSGEPVEVRPALADENGPPTVNNLMVFYDSPNFKGTMHGEGNVANLLIHPCEHPSASGNTASIVFLPQPSHGEPVRYCCDFWNSQICNGPKFQACYHSDIADLGSWRGKIWGFSCMWIPEVEVNETTTPTPVFYELAERDKLGYEKSLMFFFDDTYYQGTWHAEGSVDDIEACHQPSSPSTMESIYFQEQPYGHLPYKRWCCFSYSSTNCAGPYLQMCSNDGGIPDLSQFGWQYRIFSYECGWYPEGGTTAQIEDDPASVGDATLVNVSAADNTTQLAAREVSPLGVNLLIMYEHSDYSGTWQKEGDADKMNYCWRVQKPATASSFGMTTNINFFRCTFWENKDCTGNSFSWDVSNPRVPDLTLLEDTHGNNWNDRIRSIACAYCRVPSEDEMEVELSKPVLNSHTEQAENELAVRDDTPPDDPFKPEPYGLHLMIFYKGKDYHSPFWTEGDVDTMGQCIRPHEPGQVDAIGFTPRHDVVPFCCTFYETSHCQDSHINVCQKGGPIPDLAAFGWKDRVISFSCQWGDWRDDDNGNLVQVFNKSDATTESVPVGKSVAAIKTRDDPPPPDVFGLHLMVFYENTLYVSPMHTEGDVDTMGTCLNNNPPGMVNSLAFSSNIDQGFCCSFWDNTGCTGSNIYLCKRQKHIPDLGAYGWSYRIRSFICSYI